MQLPGGLWRDGVRHRRYRFRPVNGATEQRIAECAASDTPVPAQVTAVLASCLERVGDREADADVVGMLCVADRQYLMRQLAARLGLNEIWITASCRHCGAASDLYVRHDRLPVKPAADSFPHAIARTRQGELRVRVPTGHDQEAVSTIEELNEARRALAARCIVGPAERWSDQTAPDPDQGESHGLSEEDVRAIETAVESVSPEPAVSAVVECPGCGRTARVDIDPYLCLRANLDQVFIDVHRLAAAYAWSEAEVLGLPRERRKLYLSLIDRARGLYG